MNGIDTAIASLLASRVDSLLNIAPGSAATSQTGAAGVDTAPTTAPPAATPAPPPSAQTALSAVALTLNAIARSGGDATPAVLGQTPIWPAAPALDIEVGGLPLFDTPARFHCLPTPIRLPPATTATANVAAAQVPVAALAAALEQTVGDSGLFYEAHLAQWLAGQRSPAELAGEAQNKLVAAAAQLPLDWASDDGDAPLPNGAARQGTGAAPNGAAQNGAPGGTPDSSAAARAMPSILTAQAARFVAGEVLASSLSDLNGQPAHAGLHSAAAQTADGGLVAEFAIDGGRGASRDRAVGASATGSARDRTVSLERRSVAGRAARLDHRTGRRRMGPQRRRRGERGRPAVAHASDAVVADARHRRRGTDADRHAPRGARAGESGRRGAARDAG